MKAIKLILITALSAASVLLTAGCTGGFSVNINTDGCQFREDRTATVPVETAKRLAVDAGAGSLRVEGKADLTEVRVTGTACAPTEAMVREIKLRAEKSGDTVSVETLIPNSVVVTGSGPHLNLVIEAPADLVATVKDTSGDLTVAKLAGVTIEDGSGEITVDDVTGAVEVRDDSGDIEIRGAGADVSIPSDGSGSIHIDGVKGQVHITRDDSGDIEVRNAGGDVTVDQDDSGSISISKVTGNVTIGDDGSGDIDVTDTTGSVTVRSDDSGSIAVRDVKGDFTVSRDGSGDIRYSSVGGKVTVPHK